MYYFRDEQGLEVDFVLPGKGGRWQLLEARSGRTATPAMVRPLQSLAAAMGSKFEKGWLIHRPAAPGAGLRTLAPGIEAVGLDNFLTEA